MPDSPFLHFLTLEFFRERSKHIGVIAISLIVIFLLSSVLFIASSIRYSLEQTLTQEPDFVIQRIQGGERVNAPVAWMEKLVDIPGVSSVTARVYGRYFFKAKEKSSLLLGVDFLDEQSHNGLKKIVDEVDIRRFLSGSNMLVGSGVADYLKSHFYPKSYNFLTPDGDFKKVNIFKVLPSDSKLISNDIIILPLDIARDILGIEESEVSDIALNVPNNDERSSVESKISSLYYDVRVISKKDIEKAYANLFNYKGGIFLILYMIAIVTFVLILYQRYSMVYSSERRHIGLLRALGWSIRDVLKLKFYETIMVISAAFITGVFLAYIYVFVFGAPLLREIFLGGANLNNSVVLIPVLDYALLSSIFLIYAVPFLSAVLVPVWKISVTSPKEAML